MSDRSVTAWLSSSMTIDESTSVGHFSAVGVEDSFKPGLIMENVIIGHHCVVYQSTQLHPDVIVDDYCRIGSRTVVGRASRILYGAKIYADVRIGAGCIVGGFIPNRVVIEDMVTFFGTVAHSYRDATIPWDSVEEPSPIVRRGSVVGMNALIVGPVEIGPRSYVAAGEIVKVDVPADHLFRNGIATPIRPDGKIRPRGWLGEG